MGNVAVHLPKVLVLTWLPEYRGSAQAREPNWARKRRARLATLSSGLRSLPPSAGPSQSCSLPQLVFSLFRSLAS